MFEPQASVKKLRIERNGKDLILVICEGTGSGGSAALANEVAKSTVREGKRRAVIHVVSPLGRPNYFEVARSIIQENIGLSISMRYSGSKPEDLMRLIRELSNPNVIVAGLCSDFIQALYNAGYENVTIIHPRGGGGE